MARIVETAHTAVHKKNAPVNWRETLLDPIPIKLWIAPHATSAENQIRILQGVTKTVLQLQLIEAAWCHAGADSKTRTRPVFRIERVDLDLRAFDLHPNVLRVLRKLFETGVRVSSLVLPGELPDHCDDTKLRPGWGLFLSTALGHRALTNGKRVQLDSLVVPGIYMDEMLMVSLLSAVATTTVLVSIRVATTARTRGNDAIQSPIWKWLAYGLFSASPKNSVHTLYLENFELKIVRWRRPAEIARAVVPLATLWEEIAITNGLMDECLASELRPTVEVVTHAPIAGRGFRRPVAVVESAFSYPAVVVHDDPTEAMVDVMIPGFGFCQVLRAHTRPVADPQPNQNAARSARPLETLVVGNKRAGIPTNMYVVPLLELVGPTLTGLALEANDLDETNVRDAARLCPKLQSLRLRGVTLHSMDAITDLYDQDETFHVSSLELRDVKHMRIASIETFLKHLAVNGQTNDRLVNTLRRLRVGEGWSGIFRRSTDELIEDMLYRNELLSHFHLIGRPQNLNVGWDIEDYDFGGRAVLRQSEAGKKMSQELIQHILDFGATTWRRVHFRVDGGVVPFGIK